MLSPTSAACCAATAGVAMLTPPRALLPRSPTLSRRRCAKGLAVLTLATLLAPQAPLAAGGYDIDTAIALAPLLQLKARIADVDEELTGELLQGPQAIAAGVAATMILAVSCMRVYASAHVHAQFS